MKVVRIVGSVFALVGVGLLIVTAVLYARGNAFIAGGLRTRGVVVGRVPSWDSRSRGTATYASRVQFRTRDDRMVEFVEGISSQPPRHREGEAVQVLYDPATPARAIVDDFGGRWGAVSIVGGLGLVFAAVGLGIVGMGIRAARRRAALERSGRAIAAEFLHVFRDRSLTVNGSHPFRVAAQAIDPATGTLRRFDSAPIWVDPTAQLQGRPVTVLLGAGDDYLVDLRGIVDARAFER